MAELVGYGINKEHIENDFEYKVTRLVRYAQVNPLTSLYRARVGDLPNRDRGPSGHNFDDGRGRIGHLSQVRGTRWTPPSMNLPATTTSIGTAIRNEALARLRDYTRVRRMRFRDRYANETYDFVAPATNTNTTLYNRMRNDLQSSSEWGALDPGKTLTAKSLNEFIQKCADVWIDRCHNDAAISGSVDINLCHQNHSSHSNHGSRGRR